MEDSACGYPALCPSGFLQQLVIHLLCWSKRLWEASEASERTGAEAVARGARPSSDPPVAAASWDLPEDVSQVQAVCSELCLIKAELSVSLGWLQG